MASERRRSRITGARRLVSQFERRILILAVLAGAPGSILGLALLWTGNFPLDVRLALTASLVVTWTAAARALRRRVVRPLQAIANILGALRDGDFSIRARSDRGVDDALALVFTEINLMAETLQQRRFTALEATALLRTVMSEIDSAVFVFDESQRLNFINRSGERLLGASASRLLGSAADTVGLHAYLSGEPEHALEASFPGGGGKWRVRRSTFRQDGRPHHLLVVSDLSKALRDEERVAWQRLIRVLGHEINNSLTPIKSIAGSLHDLIGRPALPDDWRDDLRKGLAIIESRSESLNRLTVAYALLARLPRPVPAPMDVGPWLSHVAQLETRVWVDVVPGPTLTIDADRDQLEQLAINLIRNAADASLETGGSVRVGWAVDNAVVEVSIADEGLGIADTANLFVPFFTTKPSGSGIGLTLSRQIAEAHGGTLTLENRPDRRGGLARVRLPLTRH